jgi:hypothetical protein
MITSEWGSPSMFEHGLDPEDLLGRRFGHHLNFWSLSQRRLTQRIDLGDTHQLVFEVRPAHDPAKAWGFVGVVTSVEDLSGSVWAWHRDGERWAARKVITIPAEPADPDLLPPALKPFGAVPPLITDIDLSVDDRWLYVSCWGTGELKQYDVADPFHPRETGSVKLGGIIRRQPHPAAPAGWAWSGRWHRRWDGCGMVAARRLAAVAIGLAEQPGLDLVLEYLAYFGARQVRPHLDLLGGLDAAQARFDECADVIFGDILAGIGLDDCGDTLAPFAVGQADHRAVQHPGMLQQRLFDFRGVDVEPAGDDHVLGPVHDIEVVTGVEVADVAGMVPAVPCRLGRRDGILVVAGHDQGAADDDLAALARREQPALIIHDRHGH